MDSKSKTFTKAECAKTDWYFLASQQGPRVGPMLGSGGESSLDLHSALNTVKVQA